MSSRKIVNVASVPKRSPFRYPGGKTWLVPLARKWLKSFDVQPKLLVEPFAGGGIIGLTAAFEELVSHVVFVEKDPEVAAVWKCILSSDYVELSRKILEFEVSSENVKSVLADSGNAILDIAFRTIIKNRMFHGGILAPGSSLMKSGENGKGLKSRWYARTLANRINAIGQLRHKFEIFEDDGIDVLQAYQNDSDSIFFIDPPYTASGKKAGSRLYRFFELDHEKLFQVACDLNGDFLMTYDHAEGVIALARSNSLDLELVAMKNTHHAKMSELLISRDLRWARETKPTAKQLPLDF